MNPLALFEPAVLGSYCYFKLLPYRANILILCTILCSKSLEPGKKTNDLIKGSALHMDL